MRFLSHLCGGEYICMLDDNLALFLSHLCGGESDQEKAGC
ncbi:hypothetical protein [uncultured Gammaproteobacteria bacterium]|nr:hypothetical protein [uncultured Gammaproteobacteria bacterium]